jgi:hypothetical protein
MRAISAPLPFDEIFESDDEPAGALALRGADVVAPGDDSCSAEVEVVGRVVAPDGRRVTQRERPIVGVT